ASAGQRLPPVACRTYPKRSGPNVTPAEEIARPRPTAVPAARGPASSASHVCWTPFQPIPTTPKTTVRAARTSVEAPAPVDRISSVHAVEPTPARTSGILRRPPNRRSERLPKSTRPAIPPNCASARKRLAAGSVRPPTPRRYSKREHTHTG